MQTLLGLHHVTAITANAQKNLEFYRDSLGLRVVKVTVNFDDPTSYHLYFGDERGNPGSAMTFFVWPDAHRGRNGAGQAIATAFSVPLASMDFWRARLRDLEIKIEREETRFEEPVIAFADPDGIILELVGVENDARIAWGKGTVPANHGIRGFHSVTLCERHLDSTSDLLHKTLGFKLTKQTGERLRYTPDVNDKSIVPTFVDLVSGGDQPRGLMGAGVVHHVALRTPDAEQQLKWLDTIGKTGLSVSEVMERHFFRSIYFREHGGVLFEIATDGPGFTVDEPLKSLGTTLYLPPWLDARREEIERSLPTLRI